MNNNHHKVYVIELEENAKTKLCNPTSGPVVYVGLTGLSLEKRFENHKNGRQSSSVVKKHGIAMIPQLTEEINPMSYSQAKEMEVTFARFLNTLGFNVFGGH